MNIGFEAKRLFSNDTGLGRYSEFVVGALLRRYPHNRYLLYTPQGDASSLQPEIGEHPSVEVKPLVSGVPLPGLASVRRSVLLGEMALKDGVDILHGLSNELPLIKPEGLRTVLTVHDVIFARYPQFYNPIDVKIYTFKMRKALQSADRIVAVSRQTAADVRHYFGADERRVRVVYQGCAAMFKQPCSAGQREAVRRKYGLPRDFMLTVGTIESRKNLLLAVKALGHMHSRLMLVAIGQPTKYIHTVYQYAKENNLLDRIYFLHQVARADLPAIYQSASLFLYPSLFEGFGIPIVEAIASGLPVIAAQGSCLAEAGGPASVYVDPNDEKALAHAVDGVLENPQRREAMVSQSQQYIARFDEKQIAEDLMKVYAELCSKG